jgi:hypothetical protein
MPEIPGTLHGKKAIKGFYIAGISPDNFSKL